MPPSPFSHVCGVSGVRDGPRIRRLQFICLWPGISRRSIAFDYHNEWPFASSPRRPSISTGSHLLGCPSDVLYSTSLRVRVYNIDIDAPIAPLTLYSVVCKLVHDRLLAASSTFLEPVSNYMRWGPSKEREPVEIRWAVPQLCFSTVGASFLHYWRIAYGRRGLYRIRPREAQRKQVFIT